MGIGPSNEKESPKHTSTTPTFGTTPSSPRSALIQTSPTKYGSPPNSNLEQKKSKPVSIGSDSLFDDDDENHNEITLISSPVGGPIQITESQRSTSNEIPTVFNWKHGGKTIYIAGTFNEWQEKIPLRESHGDFSCIQNLPPGTYQYRFIVDGKWQIDPSQPIITDSSGEKSNLIDISVPKKEDSLLLQNVSSSPPGSYGQEIPAIIEPTPLSSSYPSTTPSSSANSNQTPPILPPHLQRALLNTTPPSAQDPTLLPLPHHVMLNHLYSLPRKEDKAMILGITQRYKTKFVTTVLYKPLDNPKSSIYPTRSPNSTSLSESVPISIANFPNDFMEL